MMHLKGINVRLMGLVRKTVKSADWKKAILEDALVRTLKNIVRLTAPPPFLPSSDQKSIEG